MSRCFPFPPPGYEKKARPDDENLLAKEKHKEKKHKKEKKDREKRDKKDKDRSEEKHREKKDRKEKSKDKKEKRKDKDKGEKKKTSAEKNTALPPSQPPPSLPLPPLENLANDTTEFKFLFELGKRTREDNERATESHMVQKINLTSQRRAELPNYSVESNHASAETNKFIIERREENNEKNQNQSYTKDIGIDSSGKRSSNLVNSANLVGVTAEKQQMEEKEKSSSSKRRHSSGESRIDKHKDKDREKKSSSKSRKKEKKENEEKTKEKKPYKDQEQVKLKETSKISDGIPNIKPLSEILGKRKEPEVNGFLHENKIRPNKLPRPATSSSNQITVNGGSKAEPSRLSNSLTPPERKGVFVNNLKTNGSNVLPNKPQIPADNGKKTEPSVNKISPSHSNSDNKTQLQTPLPNPVLENGQKLEPCQTSSQWKTGIGVRKTDKKIQNGINCLTLSELAVEKPVQEPVLKSPPLPVKKPPHPDLKYLSQILTVPRTVESFDFDDHEWLFGNTDSQNSTRIRTYSEPTPVWSEAIRMESDDITALPYVIPY